MEKFEFLSNSTAQHIFWELLGRHPGFCSSSGGRSVCLPLHLHIMHPKHTPFTFLAQFFVHFCWYSCLIGLGMNASSTTHIKITLHTCQRKYFSSVILHPEYLKSMKSMDPEIDLSTTV